MSEEIKPSCEWVHRQDSHLIVEQAREVESLRAKLDVAVSALKDANELCRSAFQISSRGGTNTNFKDFTDRLGESLKRQHEAISQINGEKGEGGSERKETTVNLCETSDYAE